MIAIIIYAVITALCELVVLLGGVVDKDDDVLLIAFLTIMWPSILATFALAIIFNSVYRVFDWIWRKFETGGTKDEA